MSKTSEWIIFKLNMATSGTVLRRAGARRHPSAYPPSRGGKPLPQCVATMDQWRGLIRGHVTAERWRQRRCSNIYKFLGNTCYSSRHVTWLSLNCEIGGILPGREYDRSFMLYANDFLCVVYSMEFYFFYNINYFHSSDGNNDGNNDPSVLSSTHFRKFTKSRSVPNKCEVYLPMRCETSKPSLENKLRKIQYYNLLSVVDICLCTNVMFLSIVDNEILGMTIPHFHLNNSLKYIYFVYKVYFDYFFKVVVFSQILQKLYSLVN